MLFELSDTTVEARQQHNAPKLIFPAGKKAFKSKDCVEITLIQLGSRSLAKSCKRETVDTYRDVSVSLPVYLWNSDQAHQTIVQHWNAHSVIRAKLELAQE